LAADSLKAVTADVIGCRRCPRLVGWREAAALDPPRRFRGEQYWAKPVPGFGDARARLLIVGLAPATHGGNRTGRIFTGDRSGDWLFAALYRASYANQSESKHRQDGLRLTDAYISAVVRCAPPGNRPTPEERDNCLPYLVREISLLRRLKVIIPLGSFAWDGALAALRMLGEPVPRPKPRFGHGAEAEVGRYVLLGCFHPSQQNTFTGRLTEQMTDSILVRARELTFG
jgi:uracil-DNA glycosylase family 4